MAGVIDAVGRYTGNPLDWNYRFAGYENDKEVDHVYVVVVLDTGKEIWLDPAPIFEKALGSYVDRDYNDRFVIPKCVKDKFVKSMLVRLSGASMGTPNPTGPSITPNSLVYSDGTTGDGSAGAALLDTVVPGAGTAIDTVLSVLPNGAFKDFIQSFVQNPEKALISLIKGRTYTSGDYKLGELYMRNILGMENVQSWEQVPDAYVPQAWAFFCCLIGVRIRTFDDMDALTGTSASPPAGRGLAYLQREPTETADISPAAASRAATVLGDTSVSLFNMWNNRDVKWPLTIFTQIPYIYPLPGPAVNQNFTGIHPVLGTRFENGYPTDYTGTRYTNQLQQTQQTGFTVTSSATAQAAPPASSSAGVGILLVALAGGALLMGSKSKHKVSGISKKSGMLLGLIALGAGGLYLWANSPAEKRKKLLAWAATITDANRKTLWMTKVPLLTDDEISALYDYLINYELPGATTMPQSLLVQMNAIYSKYGIPDYPDAITLLLTKGGAPIDAGLLPVYGSNLSSDTSASAPSSIPSGANGGNTLSLQNGVYAPEPDYYVQR
jgi:hypothetical protein